VKIVYIGSSTTLSYIPLHALIESGHSIDAIAVWGQGNIEPDNPKFPVLIEGSHSLATLAAAHAIPLIGLTGDWLTAARQFVSIAPDVILVSCFGRKLPEDIISIARHGCFNLHPSPLPLFRGPAPVFWQFRAGVESLGVSLHYVSSRFDAGDIVAQARVAIPDGVDGGHADSLLATAGSRLFETMLRSLECGSLQRQPQSHVEASYQGFPSPADYAVSTRWTARRMYNFICAIRAPGVAFSCGVDGRVYQLTEANSYSDTIADRTTVMGDKLSIACSGGVVEAVCAGERE